MSQFPFFLIGVPGFVVYRDRPTLGCHSNLVVHFSCVLELQKLVTVRPVVDVAFALCQAFYEICLINLLQCRNSDSYLLGVT